MLPLIKHLQEQLVHEPRLKSDPKPQSGYFRRIFVKDHPFSAELKDPAQAIIASAGELIKKHFKNFSAPGTVQALQQLDALAAALITPFRNDPHLQAFLKDTYSDPDTRQWVEDQLARGFLFSVVTSFVSTSANKPEDKELRELCVALQLASDSQEDPLSKRMGKVRPRLPLPTVAPTLCYFAGKNDPSLFGHVAIGLLTENIPHDLVLSAEAPPGSGDSKENNDYLSRLPIDPDHHAFLVAGQGCGLVLRNVPLAENATRLAEEIAKKQAEAEIEIRAEAKAGTPLEALTTKIALARAAVKAETEANEAKLCRHESIETARRMPENKGEPILIKQGDKLYIYGLASGSSKKSKAPGDLGLRIREVAAEDREAFSHLTFEADRRLPDGDPALAKAMKTLKKYHTPHSNVYYISKNQTDGSPQITQINGDPEILDQFKTAFLREELSPGEAARYQAYLAADKILEANKILNALPRFHSYLTYGSDPDPAKRVTGIGTDRNFEEEQIAYGDEQYLLTLPPRASKLFQEAQTQFAKRDRADYFVLGTNCVKAVYDFMKTSGQFPPDYKVGHGAPRPARCASRVCDLIKLDLEKSRKKTLADELLTPVEKLRRLIQIEIDRLELQIKHDAIRHFAGKKMAFKNPAKKKEKISNLTALLSLLAPVTELAPAHRTELERVIGAMKDKIAFKNSTAAHLQDCLVACFNEPPVIAYKAKGPAFENLKQAWTKMIDHLSAKNIDLNLLILVHQFRIAMDDYLKLLKKDDFGQDEIFEMFEQLAASSSFVPSLGMLKNLDEVGIKLADYTRDPEKFAGKENEDVALQFNKTLSILNVLSSFTFTQLKLQKNERPKLTPDDNMSVPAAFYSHLQPNKKAPMITIRASVPFLGPRPSPPTSPFPAVRLDPAQWYSVKGNTQSEYRYLKGDGLDPKRMLLAALAEPLKTTAPTALVPNTPAIPVGESVISTHVLPVEIMDSPLRIGLLEKCIKPGLEHTSEIIPPKTGLTPDQWLLAIDCQMQENFKKTRKPGKIILIESLDLRELTDPDPVNRRSLEPRETAYIQYCLAMDVACHVRNGEKEIRLAPVFLEKIMPGFNREELKQTILAARIPASLILDEDKSHLPAARGA